MINDKQRDGCINHSPTPSLLKINPYWCQEKISCKVFKSILCPTKDQKENWKIYYTLTAIMWILKSLFNRNVFCLVYLNFFCFIIDLEENYNIQKNIF